MRTYISRPNRKPIALVVGALIGAAGVAIWAALTSYGMILLFPLFFIVALIIWSIGLVVVGAPLWAVFDRAGWTSPSAAIALGFGATVVGAVLIQLGLYRDFTSLVEAGREIVVSGQLTPYGWLAGLRGWIPLGMLGGLVGFSIWRLSYERVPRS